MPRKNLHSEPFDETTIVKLEIFEDYAQAWIPTFVMSGEPVICIFDFFAGTGYDLNGIAGSPIRILQKVKEQIKFIFQKNVKIKVFFNEFDKDKYNELKKSCNEYLIENTEVGRAIELSIFNEDFELCFPKLLPLINKFPSLVYLDQNGIKFLSEKYFLELEKTKKTDFLYFVSSSFFRRFGNTKEFKMHLHLDMDEANKHPYKFIHRILIEQLRKKLPTNTKLKLYPFTLKKGPNIYGIIFGASSPRAVDKFLSIAWKRNTINGQANFDIDEDKQKYQLDLFEGKKLNKIEAFQQKLREKVLSGNLKNNHEVFNFVLEEGHIGTHAKDELVRMKKEKLIDFEGLYPLVTYENVYNLKKVLTFKVLKK